MHADTNAIRAYATATADLAGQLHAAAALLGRDNGAIVTEALGPVGVRFAAALTAAASGLAARVAAIGEHMSTSGTAATDAAGGYDDVEERSRAQIAAVGM